MRRKSQKSTDVSCDILEGEPSEIVISSDGDICLKVKTQSTGSEHAYRCSRDILRQSSAYFDVLLDPIKFSEGIAIEAQLEKLHEIHDGLVPFSKLPSIVIADSGELQDTGIPWSSLVRLFLKILHDPAVPWPVSRPQSTHVVALLAIIADRFAAYGSISSYLKRQNLDGTLLKDRKSSTAPSYEPENRQRLLAGMIFGFPHWVFQCSAALIIDGPKRWATPTLEASRDEREGGNAPWWRLPGGVEEEIACRRDYVLDTLSSIQKHFIALYASRQPQCRLGYGSSPNCDSFQLGEIVRFFTRKGLLRIESSFTTLPEDDIGPYTGSIEDIVSKFRECTSYQIDDNHQHCGLRTKLMPILESLSPLNQVSICLACWKRDASSESWLENPHGGKWLWRKRSRQTSACQAHRDVKAMYTAESRDWTPVDVA